jgi:hypothetical protein
MCCEHAVITCLNILLAFILFLVIMCYEHAMITRLFVYRFDIKNVIKIHFAMKTLKRVNMVMWALETKV